MSDAEEYEDTFGFGDEDDDTTMIELSSDDPIHEANVQTSYEFLDHPADVQIHAWGESLPVAFEQSAMAMFNYMTRSYDQVQKSHYIDINAEGEDEISLLYKFLDEFLYRFSSEPFFFPRVVKVLDYDAEKYTIRARGYGEPFDIERHLQGTEVKAITYSNMQIHHKDDGGCELFVIIDI